MATFIEPKIIWFYLAIFGCVVLIKKICRIRVAINTIWFSVDGSIPEDVISNLTQLAGNIKKSVHRHNYRLYFWTDLKKMDSRVKKRFQKLRIIVKDYRDVCPADQISKSAIEWVEHLLMLGSEKNKLFYVLASDILRLYLLLKEFPANYRFSYTCYIDCNDINLNRIPNPRVFMRLRHIAFHFVEFSYSAHAIFAKLATCSDDMKKLLTNDVIIVANKNNTPLFNKIFANYCANLNNINQLATGAIDTLRWTRNALGVIDDDLIRVMIFTTTHMINTLYANREEVSKIFLLEFAGQQLQKSELNEIQDAADFIEFERDYDKGFTCLTRDNFNESEYVVTENGESCRQFWYQLFIQRYELINRTDPQT